MKFHDSDPAIAWKYAVHERSFPPAERDRIIEEMRLANRYYNALVEIQRRRTENYQAARRRLFPDYESLETRAAELDTTIQAERQLLKAARAAQKKRVVDPVRSAKISGLKDDLRQVRAALKELRETIKSHLELAAEADSIDENANAERKAARKERQCSWGTGGEIEMSVMQAAGQSHGMPAFRRWDGGGKFVVQLQGGLSVADAFAGQDRRLRIDDLRDRFAARPGRRERLTTIHLRIGSEGREPVWVSIPIIFHRPLPEDAIIKRVAIVARRRGTVLRWCCLLTVARPEGWAKEDQAGGGTVGIDVGWRIVPEGLRVAYWAGEDGREGQVVIPRAMLDRWERLEDQHSARDKAFDIARDRLADWLDERRDRLPEWLVERSQSLRQWRSAPRLWRLVGEWRTREADSIDGADELLRDDRTPEERKAEARAMRAAGDFFSVRHSRKLGWLRAWWLAEQRMADGLAGAIRRLDAQRQAIFDEFAVRMRREYAIAHVESLNWARMQKNAEAEDGDEDGALKHHMRHASVGRLLETLRKHVRSVRGVPAKDTTRRCPACGFVRAVDGTQLVVECEECGDRMDIDRRAALNLLRAETVPESASGTVPEPVS